MDNQRIYLRYFFNDGYASNENTYPQPSGFTYVFNGTITWNGPGWNEIVLTTPFNYDPSWGLEILYENRDGSKIGGPPSFYTTSTSNYSSVYKSQDASFPTGTGTRDKTHRPNTWFVTPTTEPPNPAIAVVPVSGSNNAAIDTDLMWNPGGGSPTGYRLWFGTDNPPSNLVSALLTNDTSYSPPAHLDYGTDYFWRVVPFNDFGPALDCPVWTFRTMDDPSIVDFPHLQGFEGSWMPSGWNQYTGTLTDPITLGNTSVWEQDDWQNVNTGDKAACLNVWGSLSAFLISPLFNVSSDEMVLSFDLAVLRENQTPEGTPPNNDNPDDRIAVLIGDGFTWSTANIVREYNNSGSEFVLNDIPTTGTRVSIPLADHTGRIKVALFAGSSTSNAYNDIMFNNFRIGLYSAQPQAPLPSIAIHSASGLPRLNWGEVPEATIYHIFKADSPYGLFSPLGSTSSTYYPLTATSAKAFFKITAE